MTGRPWTDELAAAVVAGRIEREALRARLGALLVWPRRRMHRLVERILLRFGGDARPSERAVRAHLAADRAIRLAVRRGEAAVVASWLEEPRHQPARGAPSTWALPTLRTTADLASMLGLSAPELEWFAGRWSARRADGSAHYRRSVVRKKDGAWRILEAPRPRLKAIQRLLLDEAFAAIPPHDAAHGFVPGRSVATHAARHAGRKIVLRLDLRDYFPTIPRRRIAGLMRAAGYPEGVARTLSDLVTCVTPAAFFRLPPVAVEVRARGGDGPPPSADHDPRLAGWSGLDRARELHRARHLPQGAPTSPHLANLCTYRLDLRLSGLARAAGATYTRYADDLTFSGDEDLARRARRFLDHAAAICVEEGFAVNHRKTRVQRQGTRQSVTGVVVNARPGVSRAERDRLRAILHRCARFGPAAENREGHADFRAHLLGRISWVASIRPEHGPRLRELFDRIAW